MANLSLEGLTLNVADLERSLAFYTRLPGVAVEVHKPGIFAMLRIGKGRMGLWQRAAGRFHIELETDNLDAYYEAVRQAGIEPKGPPVLHPWGERDFHVVDPDGFDLEFQTATEEGDSDAAP
jgi:catechol 2,3-dioxygenase-like lactoylglutathione lyase family enzyme